MSNELSALAQQMLPELDEEMRTVLHYPGAPGDTFTGMMHYAMGWVDTNLQPVEPKSGKRIRPLLCMLANDAAGGDWDQAIPPAAAIEILHNFSLVHDDIEDISPTRRGRPTVWKIWGEAQAINTGDAMFTAAHIAMSRLLERGVPPAIVVRALRRFDETCFLLTAGQYADMAFETRDIVSVDEYVKMITGKTSVLIGLAAELGALVANAPVDVVEHYAAFGLNLGLAFQVIDDILGIWGDETKTGKSAATDIITKKKTMPVLYGLEQSEALQTLYNESEADAAFVSQVVELLDAVGAREYAVGRAQAYSSSAVEHLEAADPTGYAGQALYQLTDMLLMRDM
jgi:geranylgeranyl diphosphate synthase type I